MKVVANSVKEYLESVPEERKIAFKKLYDAIVSTIPEDFSNEISYGMIGWVVPHSIYPEGYHCTPELPLPFLSIASQKNFVAVYHMGIYADEELLDWFITEFPKHSKRKLDMGKSCIRFKKTEDIPFELIAELSSKMTVKQWIDLYESKFRK